MNVFLMQISNNNIPNESHKGRFRNDKRETVGKQDKQ